MKHSEWIASDYLDTDECGILNFDNEIIASISMDLTRPQCEHIVHEHNKALRNYSEFERQNS